MVIHSAREVSRGHGTLAWRWDRRCRTLGSREADADSFTLAARSAYQGAVFAGDVGRCGCLVTEYVQ